jgi:hypothetical protein
MRIVRDRALGGTYLCVEKAWPALRLPEEERWQEKHREERSRLLRMNFVTFQRTVNVPAEMVRTGRKFLYRVLR